MDHSRFKFLFRKLMNRSATELEKQQLRQFLDTQQDELFPYQEWQDTYTGGKLPAGLTKLTTSSILGNGVPVMHMRNNRSRLLRAFTVTAAAILLLITGMYWLQHRGQSRKPNHLVVSTAWGEEKKITLPDGSVIHLNGGSTLRVPELFNQQRTVNLEGEAFFDVKQSPGLPFVVTSGSITTTVLGTSFNIASQPGNNITVSVKSGKVKLATIGVKEVLLTEGMQASYDTAQVGFIVSTIQADHVGSWGNQNLFFRNASLEEICLALERKHGIQFKASNPVIFQCRYSTVFDKLTLQASLNKLALLGNLRFQQKDSLITISGSPCQP